MSSSPEKTNKSENSVKDTKVKYFLMKLAKNFNSRKVLLKNKNITQKSNPSLKISTFFIF